MRGMRLTNEQCREVFGKYMKWFTHQASPAERENASKAFASFCIMVQKQGPPVAAPAFKTSAQASNELQKLLEEVQTQVRSS
ncbi:hypothetical protein WJX73_002010 [Symbiochloris irregularis]|uniref:Uncharacterized protein n=1 Tax=Symbiochloris irregularis TaxID=706552 RepID=A0AAW1PIW0_9CHLO